MDEMSCATGICVAFILLDFAVFTPCCGDDVCCDDPTLLFVFWNCTGEEASKYNRGGQSGCSGGIKGGKFEYFGPENQFSS